MGNPLLRLWAHGLPPFAAVMLRPRRQSRITALCSLRQSPGPRVACWRSPPAGSELSGATNTKRRSGSTPRWGEIAEAEQQAPIAAQGLPPFAAVMLRPRRQSRITALCSLRQSPGPRVAAWRLPPAGSVLSGGTNTSEAERLDASLGGNSGGRATGLLSRHRGCLRPLR